MNPFRYLWLKLWSAFHTKRTCPCGGTIHWREGKDLPRGGWQMGGARCDRCGFGGMSNVFGYSEDELRQAWQRHQARH